MDRLPFMWCLVPVNAWESVLTCYVENMESSLKKISNDSGSLDPKALLEDQFERDVSRIGEAEPSLQAVFQSVGSKLLGRAEPPEYRLILEHAGRAIVLNQRDYALQALLNRVPDFKKWPQSEAMADIRAALQDDSYLNESLPTWDTVELPCDYPGKSTLLCAPVYAALLALTEKSVWATEVPRQEWINEFKRIRQGYEAWFDEAFRTTFLVSYGTMKELERGRACR